MQSSSHARDVAFQSMAEAASYGSLISFFRELFKCHTIEEIATQLFSAMSDLNLHVSLQVRGQETITKRDDGQGISPIEEELFSMLKRSGRIYPFGQRCLFNQKHASILVKNMPDDEVESGRLRDLLCVVVEGLEIKVQDLMRQATLDTALSSVRQVNLELSQKLKQSEADGVDSADSVNDLFQEIERSFDFLDLSEEQEAFFMDLMGRSRREMGQLTQYVYEMKARMKHLVEVLEKASSSD